MSCSTLSDRLHEYVDGELPAEARAEVEAHLAGCAACREDRAALEHLGALVRREMVDPGAGAALAGLWPAIEARLDAPAAAGAGAPRARVLPFLAGRSREGTRPARRAVTRLVGAAAAVLLVALALPIGSWWLGSVDQSATVASVETGESATVVLLAGSDTQPPIIWITESDTPPGVAPLRDRSPL